MVGVLGFEPRISCSRSRRIANFPTPRWCARRESNPLSLRCQRRILPVNYERKKWCAKRDSNSHDLSAGGLSCRWVCQFPHSRVFATKILCLTVAIWTQEAEIASCVVACNSVDMIDLQDQWLPAPYWLASAHETFVLNAGLDHSSTESCRALTPKLTIAAHKNFRPVHLVPSNTSTVMHAASKMGHIDPELVDFALQKSMRTARISYT